MLFDTYTNLAVRTLKDKGYRLNILHGLTGVFTELGELADAYKRHVYYGTPLDIVNVTEEVGDILWYVAILSKTLDPQGKFNLSFNFIDPEEQLYVDDHVPLEADAILLNIISMSIDVGQLVASYEFGFVKGGDTPVEEGEFLESAHMELRTILLRLKWLCIDMGVDIKEAAVINISKLEIRYPEKFTETAAVNRNTDAERAHLEDAVIQ